MLGANFLSPPVLFFLLGMLATMVRSDLHVPSSLARFLGLYLLLAIGLHGGHELARSPLDLRVVVTLGLAALASAMIPLWSFAVLRRWLDTPTAAAAAACYGSVSAVTFAAAATFLESQGRPYSGFLVAAMALMETPAILVGVWLVRRFGVAEGPAGESTARAPWRVLLHESLANGAVVILLGSLVIGLLTGPGGWEMMQPLVKTPFHGVLCLFLLDMGMVAARRLGELRRAGAFVLLFALLAPPLHALLGIATAALIGLSAGDALLLAVLFGSASYIAVPAAMRLAVPQANAGVYLPMALGLTFPFNITIGLPLYLTCIEWLWVGVA